MPTSVDGLVCDAGPLIALARTSQLHLLDKLFEPILVTQTVFTECTSNPALPGAMAIAAACQSWAILPDPFIRIHFPPSLSRGDQSVIQLASDTGGVALLDDARARRAAKANSVRFAGTIAILLKAKNIGLIDRISPIFNDMLANGYRMSKELRQAALEKAGEE